MRGGFGTRIVLFIATNIAVLLVATVVLRLLGVNYYLAEEGIHYGPLLAFAAVIGFGGAFISLAMSKWIAKRFMGVRVIDQPADDVEAWLQRSVEQLAQQSNIVPPEVGIYESDDMNAFATGARRNSALVAVSTGLLQRMRRDEAEAVLAHEVAHCANGEMITLALIQGVLNTFVIFLSRVIGFFVDKLVFRSARLGLGYFLTVIVMQIVLGILASFVVAWFSRRREYRADAAAAGLVGPSPMIAALERLKGVEGPADMPQSMRAFGIRGGGVMALLSTHPPLDHRIAALRGER